MMQGMMDCGVGGWLMVGAGSLVLVVLILAVAALVKYLFSAGRGGPTRSEP